MPGPHMNGFPQGLPPELLTEIISLCPKSVVSSLCRVSRLIYDISFPILYRHLELGKSSLFIKCSRTLLASNVASKSVRWLILSFNHATLLSAFYQVLGKVLLRLSRLSILRISVAVPNAAYFTILSNCHFPHLLIFEIISQRRSMATKNFLELLAFLHRHSSTITALSLDVPASKTLSTGKLPMHFPSLSKFIGNIALVPYLFQRPCSLRSMHFLSTRMFRLDDEHIDNLFEHVQRVAGNTLEHVELLASSFGGSQPRILARHLPNIKVLMLAHLSYAESNGKVYSPKSCFSAVKNLLPSFQQLERLAIRRDLHVPGGRNPILSLRESHKLMKECGSICPKLIEVALFGPEWFKVHLAPNGPGRTVSFWLPCVYGFMSDAFETSAIAWWTSNVMWKYDNPVWINFLKSSTVRPQALVQLLEHAVKRRLRPETVELVRTRANRLLEIVDKNRAELKGFSGESKSD